MFGFLKKLFGKGDETVATPPASVAGQAPAAPVTTTPAPAASATPEPPAPAQPAA